MIPLLGTDGNVSRRKALPFPDQKPSLSRFSSMSILRHQHRMRLRLCDIPGADGCPMYESRCNISTRTRIFCAWKQFGTIDDMSRTLSPLVECQQVRPQCPNPPQEPQELRTIEQRTSPVFVFPYDGRAQATRSYPGT